MILHSHSTVYLLGSTDQGLRRLKPESTVLTSTYQTHYIITINDMNKKQVESIMNKIRELCPELIDVTEWSSMEIPLPIYLRHILSVLTEEQLTDPTIWTEVLFNWHCCGLLKSLDEIIEKSGWECVWVPCGSITGIKNKIGGGQRESEQLKSPEARALFEFLKSIFLTNK